MGVIAQLGKRSGNKLRSVCAIFMHPIERFERTFVRATESLSGLQAGVDTSEVSEERADLLLATLLVLLGSVG